MPLNDQALRSAKPRAKDYKLYDEKGLFVLVKVSGKKYWRFKYRYNGKEKVLALGVYPEAKLKNVRKKRDDARELLADNIDPSAERKTNKLMRTEQSGNTFSRIAHEWFETHIADKSDSHRSRTKRLLDVELLPHLGECPVQDINARQLLAVLKKIQDRGVVDTAHRAKQVAGQVLKYAIVTGRVERNVANDVNGALKPRRKKHYAALTEPSDVGNLMVAIDRYEGTAVVKAALRLSPLLFLRPGELRALEWEYINWDECRIIIPKDSMKMGQQDHIVPLSIQAVDILNKIRCSTGQGRFIFPAQGKRGRPMSDNTIRTALLVMGYDNTLMTAHGFRAMARTLLDEVLEYRIEWIEQQLAHAVRDANGRAYNRTKHLKQRTEMMQKWADYLDSLKSKKVFLNQER